MPTDFDADANADAPRQPPPPILPPPIEGNKDGEGDDDKGARQNVQNTKIKPEHWTKYVEAVCGISLVFITFYYTRAAYRQLESMNTTYTEIKKQTKSAQQSAYASCLGARMSSISLVESQRAMIENHRAAEAATYQALAATQAEAADLTVEATQAQFQAGKPFRVAYVFKNEGKTTAINFNFAMRLEVVPRWGKAALVYPNNDASRRGSAIRFVAGEVYPPTSPQSENIPPDINLMDARKPDGELIVASPRDVEDMRSGKADLVFYSHFTYSDIFKVKHETFYCTGFEMMTGGWQTLPHDECRQYNKIDTNAALKPPPALPPDRPISDVVCIAPKED